jgi:hypothetical protein
MAEEIKPGEVRYDPTSVGTSGLRQFGGYIQEEFLKDLKGTNAARLYREMSDNDPIVGALLFAVTMLIRQVNWRVQAADDSPEAEDAKAFVEEVMDDMSTSWASVMAEVSSMFIYGFAPLEIIWKKRIGPDEADGSRRSKYTDGKIGIRALALRAQNTIPKWLIDPIDGSIDGMWQQPYDRAMVLIPIEKLLLFRTTEDRQNPEGRSILRNAYRPWYLKKKIEELEGVGIERDLAGLPVALIPNKYLSPTADAVEKQVFQNFKRMIASVKRDNHEGLILPSDRDAQGNLRFEVKLMSTGGARQFDTTKVVDRYNRAIATSVLADFIFLGQGSTGSFALSSNKTEIFATAIGAYLNSIAETFNRHLLPRLWKLNGMDYEFMPTLVPGDLEKPDITALSDFVSKLTSAGAQMFPDRELENHLREAAGLPLAPEESEMDMDEEINPLLNPNEDGPQAPAQDEQAQEDEGEED